MIYALAFYLIVGPALLQQSALDAKTTLSPWTQLAIALYAVFLCLNAKPALT